MENPFAINYAKSNDGFLARAGAFDGVNDDRYNAVVDKLILVLGSNAFRRRPWDPVNSNFMSRSLPSNKTSDEIFDILAGVGKDEVFRERVM